jgi:hypothetical protein
VLAHRYERLRGVPAGLAIAHALRYSVWGRGRHRP